MLQKGNVGHEGNKSANHQVKFFKKERHVQSNEIFEEREIISWEKGYSSLTMPRSLG